MKNKNYFLFLAFAFMIVFSGISQSKLSAEEEMTFKAKVQKTAENTQSIISDFTQTKHLSVLDHNISSEGKLVFKAPNLVKWMYLKPYKNSAIFKDDQLLVTNEGKKDKIDLSSNKLFRSLNSLIVNSIKGDMFDASQFELAYFKYDDAYLVKFVPKDKRMQKFIAAFELKFSNPSAEVEEVRLIEPNDDYTLITFSNRKVNTRVAESDFDNK
ncbi:outer membrane lipoprotein carrier protein LolA [Gelidibacter mesophilus]|uniref:outer membrane lipoprotein carrier protein LolA n=1 Tax=Gelidibacter mesophilus TaxID=169050 RepID=UPI000410A9D1|nr:outer membrane lipoprotein carrier protein LolA [Gelidibacter mesophilus]